VNDRSSQQIVLPIDKTLNYCQFLIDPLTVITLRRQQLSFGYCFQIPYGIYIMMWGTHASTSNESTAVLILAAWPFSQYHYLLQWLGPLLRHPTPIYVVDRWFVFHIGDELGLLAPNLQYHIKHGLSGVTSISTTNVCNTSYETWALPNTFFNDILEKPTSLSQKPPYHRARFGINFL